MELAVGLLLVMVTCYESGSASAVRSLPSVCCCFVVGCMVSEVDSVRGSKFERNKLNTYVFEPVPLPF